MPAPRTLILMRHAEAGGAHSDHDRPLTSGGLADATTAGGWIRETLPEVTAVACSTALRTRQTLAATGIDAPVLFADELYGGGIDDILTQIGLTPDGADTLLVVGHAPGIPSTAYELATVAALMRAAVAEAADPTGGDHQSESRVEPGEPPELDGLRHFSAGAVAVLTTGAGWAELAERGAELLTVRNPRG